MSVTLGSYATIVVATRNRREAVCRAIRSLLVQDYPRELYEIIVVCDRCEDDTESMLNREFGEEIRVLSHSTPPGQAGAREQGWRSAHDGVVIFIDDEVRAWPSFVSAHVRVHTVREHVAVTGYSPIVLSSITDAFQAHIAHELDKFYRRLSSPGRKSTPQQLAGFNFSVRREALEEVGGFRVDAFYGERDDFDLAERLIEAGYEIEFCPDARGDQELATSTGRLIERARFQALKDADLARRYPRCIPYLHFFVRFSSRRERVKTAALWLVADDLEKCLAMWCRWGGGSLWLELLRHEARYYSELRTQFRWRELQRMCRKHD